MNMLHKFTLKYDNMQISLGRLLLVCTYQSKLVRELTSVWCQATYILMPINVQKCFV